METDQSEGARFVERTGPQVGREHVLDYGEHVVGRGREASIDLDDKDVSRRHAHLTISREGVDVVDLESKNGVFVDSERITRVVRLVHGQRFTIGGVTLEVNHTATKVGRALARAGEPTVTRTRVVEHTPPAAGGLLLPLLGAIAFGGLVAALLLL